MTYLYTNSYPTMITAWYRTPLDGRVGRRGKAWGQVWGQLCNHRGSETQENTTGGLAAVFGFIQVALDEMRRHTNWNNGDSTRLTKWVDEYVPVGEETQPECRSVFPNSATRSAISSLAWLQIPTGCWSYPLLVWDCRSYRELSTHWSRDDRSTIGLTAGICSVALG